MRSACATPSLPPRRSASARGWLLYGVGAFVYRAVHPVRDHRVIAGKFFIVGVLLAMWALGTQVLTPVGKSVSFLASDPGLRRQRGRQSASSVAVALGVLALVFFAPAPSWTRAEGVVWVPKRRRSRRHGGFVERVLVPSTARWCAAGR